MKNLIFLLLTINSSLLFAAYPFDNPGMLEPDIGFCPYKIRGKQIDRETG